MKGILFIISAPSGSGKSTLVNELRKLVPGLEFSISYTTRPPRGSEKDGREYHFVDRAEFEAMVARNEFLEHAEVFGNYYGTSAKFPIEATQRSHDVILDIDVQGERQVKALFPDAVSIFILPPSREVLEWRLRHRSQAEHMNAEEVIHRRLETAKNEIVSYPEYGYILVNDRLDQAVDELAAIVLSERAKRSGASLTAEDQEHVARAEKCLRGNTSQRVKAVLDSFGIPMRQPEGAAAPPTGRSS